MHLVRRAVGHPARREDQEHDLGGEWTPDQRRIYTAVLEAQTAGIAEVKAGADFLAAHRAAMWVLLTIYHRLLGRIAARKMDVFSERVSVGTVEKVGILARGAVMSAWNRVTG